MAAVAVMLVIQFVLSCLWEQAETFPTKMAPMSPS